MRKLTKKQSLFLFIKNSILWMSLSVWAVLMAYRLYEEEEAWIKIAMFIALAFVAVMGVLDQYCNHKKRVNE